MSKAGEFEEIGLFKVIERQDEMLFVIDKELLNNDIKTILSQ